MKIPKVIKKVVNEMDHSSIEKLANSKEMQELAEMIRSASTQRNIYHFYLMDHRGGLKEAVDTIQEITELQYKETYRDYEYYAYDERIECLRYIIKDLEHNYKYPAWLLISQCSIATIKAIVEREQK